MMLKHKKIFIGGIVATSIGTLTGILVPLLNKKFSSSDGEQIENYQSLVTKIIDAKNQQVAKGQAMKFYGLEPKDDVAIDYLADETKMQYQAAITLGKYIFKNKHKYQINVYEGKDINALKQLLLVFKLKSNHNPSQVDEASDWLLNKIDDKQDEFAFLYTIFKNKFVSGKFKQGKQMSVSNGFVTNFKTKEYKILELFTAFKAANPDKNDFSKYNIASDSNAAAIKAITKYIVSLVDGTTILPRDLVDYIKFTKRKLTVSSNIALGTITFNYKTYSETKNVDFIYAKKYQISIKPGSEAKTADEVKISDIQFVGVPPVGILVQSTKVSTQKPDGSVVQITFKLANGANLLITSQELDGFTSYKQKALKIINMMTNAHFSSIVLPKVLPSDYNNKRAILNLIHNEIEAGIADVFEQKVKEAITLDNINLKPNNDEGSLVIAINTLNYKTREFKVQGFLTQAAADVAIVKAAIEEIKGMKKNVSDEIIEVSTNTIFDAAALNSLGTGGTFLDDIKDTTLTYTHKGISSDGDLIIAVRIVKGAAQDIATFKIAIAGINLAKANTLLQAVTDKTVDVAPTKFKQVVNGVAPKEDDINPPIQSGFSFVFKKATHVNAAGKAIVTYKVNVVPAIDGTVLREIPFIVSGFQTAAEKVIEEDKKAVSSVGVAISTGITRITKVVNASILPISKPQTFTAAVLEALGEGGIFPKDTRKTSLTYTHNGINKNGDLTVTVTIVRGSISESTTFIIDVTGIDDVVTKGRAAFKITKITNTPILPILEPQLFDAAALKSLGTGGRFPDDIKGTTLTYTHNGIENDGPLIVTVKISKGGASAIVSFVVNVSGIDQARTNPKI